MVVGPGPGTLESWSHRFPLFFFFFPFPLLNFISLMSFFDLFRFVPLFGWETVPTLALP